jgi:hypothetical protein
MRRAHTGADNSCIIESLDSTIDKLVISSEDPFSVLTLNDYFIAAGAY